MGKFETCFYNSFVVKDNYDAFSIYRDRVLNIIIKTSSVRFNLEQIQSEIYTTSLVFVINVRKPI